MSKSIVPTAPIDKDEENDIFIIHDALNDYNKIINNEEKGKENKLNKEEKIKFFNGV